MTSVNKRYVSFLELFHAKMLKSVKTLVRSLNLKNEFWSNFCRESFILISFLNFGHEMVILPIKKTTKEIFLKVKKKFIFYNFIVF